MPLARRDSGFVPLFDGESLSGWRVAAAKNLQASSERPFAVCNGAIQARGGSDIALLWFASPAPQRYRLRVDWMLTAQDDNSGVFVAFPDPEKQGYDNPAYAGVDLGFEIQIDEIARPDGNPVHRTGAVYSFQGPDRLIATNPPDVWNRFDITIDLPQFLVEMNGELINRFQFRGDPCSPRRGLPSTPRQPRFIGLQSHTGVLHFRNISWKSL
ncbi:MAG: hypothetical protein C5B46_02655 [Proteobacteria bacterium]|nr:MAG: hypothetical protein C5B46_02655 [Pseudomonadota bacterium]